MFFLSLMGKAPVLSSYFTAIRNQVRIIRVNVKNRSVHHSPNVSAMCTRPRVPWIRGESNLITKGLIQKNFFLKANFSTNHFYLIIDNHMYDTTSLVLLEIGEINCFVAHSLAREGSISMDQNSQAFRTH